MYFWIKKVIKENILEQLGFRFGRGGVHSSRTLMLAELKELLSYVDKVDASKAEYCEAIQTENCLGKRSGQTRALTYRHLVDLYSLEPNFALFRAFRFFWQRDVMASHYWRHYLLIHVTPFLEQLHLLFSSFKWVLA